MKAPNPVTVNKLLKKAHPPAIDFMRLFRDMAPRTLDLTDTTYLVNIPEHQALYDWRSYIPQVIKDQWPRLSTTERLLVAIMGQVFVLFVNDPSAPDPEAPSPDILDLVHVPSLQQAGQAGQVEPLEPGSQITDFTLYDSRGRLYSAMITHDNTPQGLEQARARALERASQQPGTKGWYIARESVVFKD